MNTEDLMRYAAGNPKLIKIKDSIRYPGLKTLKYTKTAFFGQNWNRFLEDCRGIVIRYDDGPKIAVLPFRKIYNYGIDKESPVFPLDTVVDAYRKVNGFMVAVTRVPGIDELVFSTTGSLESDFVDMARAIYETTVDCTAFDALIAPGHTYMFECTHPLDPHIVPEMTGLHFLGRREHRFDAEVINSNADRKAFYDAGCITPFKWRTTLGDLIEMVRTVEHEGFVFYTKDGQSAKLKSPYYLAAKMFGRGKLDVLLNGRAKNILDEELWPLVEHVKENREAFEAMGEQDKIVFCREFLTGLYRSISVGY